jgi:hypothetical protein
VHCRQRLGPLGIVAVVVATALGLAACSGGSTTASGPTGTSSTNSPGPPPSHAADGLDWVLTSTALSDVVQDPTALAVLEAGHIYELLSKRATPVAGVNAILTQDFTSYTAMASAINSNTLTPGVKAVLFDPENWTLTQAIEQVNAADYIQMAVTLAHQHGLMIIATPAFDLVNVIDPGTAKSDELNEFLNSTGVEQAAAQADIVDVQSQSQERNAAKYLSWVEQSLAAIDAARPGAAVIAGLSTNPSGSQVTCSELASSIAATIGRVAGYWLNVPKQGTACPKCGPDPNPQIGTCALDSYFH